MKQPLVDILYKSDLGERIWQSFLDALVNMTNADLGLILIRKKFSQDSYQYIYRSGKRQIADQELNEWTGSQWIKKLSTQETGSLYDSSGEAGVSPHILSVVGAKDQDMDLIIILGRENTPLSDSDGSLLAQISNEVQKVFQLQRQLTLLSDKSGLLVQVGENMRDGVALCNARGHVLIRNKNLQNFIDKKVVQLQNQKLKLANISEQAKFQAAVQNATGFLGHKHAQGIKLEPSITHSSIFISITPIGTSNGAANDADGVCMVSLIEPTAEDHSHYFQGMFQLTRAEADLANRLAIGQQLSDIAEDKQVSKHTVRSQLKHLFFKTETCSQNELIALLNRVLPPTTL